MRRRLPARRRCARRRDAGPPGHGPGLAQANPTVCFYLETITRDALAVPAKTDDYWASFDGVPRNALDAILTTVRATAGSTAFPTVTGLPLEKQLALERRNVEQSLKYGREKLNL